MLLPMIKLAFVQILVNYGPWAKYEPLSVFVNNFIGTQSHPFAVWMLWLFVNSNSKGKQLWWTIQFTKLIYSFLPLQKVNWLILNPIHIRILNIQSTFNFPELKRIFFCLWVEDQTSCRALQVLQSHTPSGLASWFCFNSLFSGPCYKQLP